MKFNFVRIQIPYLPNGAEVFFNAASLRELFIMTILFDGIL